MAGSTASATPRTVAATSSNLTPAGRRELGAAEGAQETVEADVLRGLEPAERAILRELLARALREAEPADVADPVVVTK